MMQFEYHLKILSAQNNMDTVSGPRECMSRHYYDGSPTNEHERDTLHQTPSNRVTVNNNHNKCNHISFLNTTIDNMTDNRVLNNRPQPTNDEETTLLTR